MKMIMCVIMIIIMIILIMWKYEIWNIININNVILMCINNNIKCNINV